MRYVKLEGSDTKGIVLGEDRGISEISCLVEWGEVTKPDIQKRSWHPKKDLIFIDEE